MDDVHTGNGRRETRLLLATIAVSVLMLLLLAQFRFPEEAARQVVEPAPAPLERLAARATYDELAGIMADLERRIAPSVTILGEQSAAGLTYVPAVRLASERAIAVLPRESRVATMPTGSLPSIVSQFGTRELVVVQVDPGASAVPILASSVRPGPRYVAVLEATARAPVIRPVYIGRSDFINDSRWPEPVLSVGAVQQTLPVGSAIFSLDGGFMGLVSESAGTVTVVPADTLRTLAAEAPTPPATRAEIAVDVQPLTPLLARASGTETGVMVTYVSNEIATTSGLTSGDVIQAVDGTSVGTVADFQQLAQTRTPGAAVALAIVRRGESRVLTVTATESGAALPGSTEEPGFVLRAVRAVGAEIVDVQPGGLAARAGLRRGDLVVSLNGKPAPGSTEVLSAIRRVSADQPIMLTVRRNGDHLVVAVEKP